MRVSFRQGVVRYQTDANKNPVFLSVSGGSVSLVVSPEPTIVTFAHGNKNYLFTERVSVANAWTGPHAPLTWLYWDLDMVTGVRTFGTTAFQPTPSGVAPGSPAIDQHWFDTNTMTMKVWNGARWIERVRVFAARLTNGTVLGSMGADAPLFSGTQAGLSGTVNVGSLVFDKDGKPVKTGDGKFFTTEDRFTTGLPTGSSVKVGASLVEAYATEDLPAGSVVVIKNHTEASAAEPLTYMDYMYGIVESDAMQDEIARVSTDGIVSCSSWDWTSLPTNTELYVGFDGQLQSSAAVPTQLPIAIVVDSATVQIKSAKLTIDLTAAGIPNASNSVYGLVKLATNSAPTVVATNDPRMTDARTPVAHTHTSANVTDFATAVNTQVAASIGTISGTIAAGDHNHNGVYSQVAHTHLKADVTDFAHNHAQSEITGLVADLAGKASTVHTHLKTDVTDFAHNHVAADVTDFNTSVLSLVGTAFNTIAAGDHLHLGVYSLAVHTHTASDTIDFALEVNSRIDARVGTLSGTIAAGDHNHTGVYSLVSHNHDTTYAALSHNHAQSEITGLVADLAGKASTVHTHLKADVTDFAHTHLKADVTDFAHTHLKADVTDFNTSVLSLVGTTLNTIAAGDHNHTGVYSQAAHTHLKADVTDFAHTHLKADVTDFAHNHAQSEITGLVADLAGKASTVHTHLKADVTDFAHTHLKADVTDFAHNHVAADVTDFNTSVLSLVGTTLNTIAAGDDPRMTDARTPVAHTHAQSEITGLVADLAGKLRRVAVPATSSVAASVNDVAWDVNFAYFYTGDGISTHTWMRIAVTGTTW